MESIIFSLSNREDLLTGILYNTNSLGLDNSLTRGTMRNQTFSDKEMCPDFIDSVRGKRVYLLSSFNDSDEVIRLNLAIDAAVRAAASEIIPIVPYFIYARGDKKDQPRGPIAAKVMARMLENSGSTSIITFDLHADQIQGFFNIPVIHIQGKNVFGSYINDIYNTNTILCSPDAGGGKRVKRMKGQLRKDYDLELNYVMIEKTRSEANVVDDMVIIGNVQGKDVIIIDDIIDTGGTLCKAAELLVAEGANSVKAIITHGICSGPALARLESSVLNELVISDSLEKPCDYNGIYSNSKIKVVSVASQIGLAIASINNGISYEMLKDTKTPNN